jgi:hypothetical protein
LTAPRAEPTLPNDFRRKGGGEVMKTKIIWMIGGFFLGIMATIALLSLGSIVRAQVLNTRQEELSKLPSALAAATNMAAGTVVEFENIGWLSREGALLPKDYVRINDKDLVIGHKLMKAVTNRQVFTWRDVELREGELPPKRD